jgi:hypothetical protein
MLIARRRRHSLSHDGCAQRFAENAKRRRFGRPSGRTGAQGNDCRRVVNGNKGDQQMHEFETPRVRKTEIKHNGNIPLATISRIGQRERVLASIIAVPEKGHTSNGYTPTLEYPRDRRRAASDGECQWTR